MSAETGDPIAQAWRSKTVSIPDIWAFGKKRPDPRRKINFATFSGKKGKQITSSLRYEKKGENIPNCELGMPPYIVGYKKQKQ